MSRIYGEADRTLGNFIQGMVNQEVVGLHNRHASDDREIGPGTQTEASDRQRSEKQTQILNLLIHYRRQKRPGLSAKSLAKLSGRHPSQVKDILGTLVASGDVRETGGLWYEA